MKLIRLMCQGPSPKWTSSKTLRGVLAMCAHGQMFLSNMSPKREKIFILSTISQDFCLCPLSLYLSPSHIEYVECSWNFEAPSQGKLSGGYV